MPAYKLQGFVNEPLTTQSRLLATREKQFLKTS